MSATENVYDSTTPDTDTTPQHEPRRHATPAPAVRQIPVRDPREKSVPLACILSLMPGLGQVYVGYYQRGFIHSLVVAALITALSTNDLRDLTPLFAMFLCFFWLYNVIDAGRRASLYNQALLGSESIELPRDFALPLRGSVWGGLLLIAAGGILLSNTRFGISLEWVEEWWPVAPILFGIYLLVKAIQDRRS
jgi:hypothetical protein